MALLIRVFDAQHKGAAHFAGEKIVEQGCAGPTYVQVTGGGRCKSGSNGRGHAPLIHLVRLFFKSKQYQIVLPDAPADQHARLACRVQLRHGAAAVH